MLRRKRAGYRASIYVVGVGGGGITAVNRLLNRRIYGVEYVVVDTDRDHLGQAQGVEQIQVTEEGRGVESLQVTLHRADLVFVVAGLGGNTATTLAPAVARIAREQGALVLSIVTLPFSFEGTRRAGAARAAATRLQEEVHTLITIPNDRLLELARDELPFYHTYNLAEEVWYHSIQGINGLVNVPGLVNVDFADVKAIMANGGPAVITRGRARGPERARQAALQATRSDLLGITIDGAQGILFNVSAGPQVTLDEVREAASVIGTRADPDANIIFGTAVDVCLEDEMEITVIATGCGIPVLQPAAQPPSLAVL
jgi:cell division protein FtsZ